MSETYREVETKFRVHGLFRLPDLTADALGTPVARVEDAGTARLKAVYYDTEDLRLAREGITLRRRQGGSDEGWHLKLPVASSPSTREEVHAPLSRSTTPPVELTELVLAYTRGAEVRPVASPETERTTRLLHAEDGQVVAELADDTVSVLDGDRVAMRFRELELELKDGEEADLPPVVSALEAAGAVPGEMVTKAARALGARATAPPDVPEPSAVSVDDPAGDAVRAHVATQVRAFRRHDVGVRRDEHDSVHQMRVAARRLRSGLQVFGDLLDPDVGKELRDELRWIAGVLGGVRDREVLLERLERDLDSLPRESDPVDIDGKAVKALMRREVGGEAATARDEALEAMRSARYLALLDGLVAMATEPPLTDEAAQPCRDVLPRLVGKAWKQLARDAEALPIDGHDEEWHETRKTAKRARYACESVVGVYGTPAKDLAKQIERVTELLGQHQDAAIAAQTCAELAGARRVSGATGFALGLLHSFERAAVHESRVHFLESWPSISRRRWRRWLET